VFGCTKTTSRKSNYTCTHFLLPNLKRIQKHFLALLLSRRRRLSSGAPEIFTHIHKHPHAFKFLAVLQTQQQKKYIRRALDIYTYIYICTYICISKCICICKYKHTYNDSCAYICVLFQYNSITRTTIGIIINK